MQSSYGLGLSGNWPVLKKKWAADPYRIQQIYSCVDCACCIPRLHNWKTAANVMLTAQ
jgi:hypothetical protein